jgi:hypothetical protein
MRRQIEEIAADPALRIYGVALITTHLLTAFWLMHHDLASMVAAGEDAFCWPLLPHCEMLRVLSAEQLRIAFGAYVAVALVSALAFVRAKDTVYGYAGLLLLTVFKLAVIALDFRLRRNQHYMAFAASGVFLFIPNKRATLQLLLVLFYFWAGTLKLNWEWLSGAALYQPLWLFTGRGVILACAYVIALELVIVWGLLARDRRVFWASFAQVFVFHVFSWAVVGFFYPLLMFGLLAIFPLVRFIPIPTGAETRRFPRAALAVAVVFSLMQLSTHLYPGDTAITGEGRLFALHMFDARVVCEATATFEFPDGRRIDADFELESARTACDPIMIHGVARNLCRKRDAGQLPIVDLDLKLLARRATDEALQPVIEIENFCANQPRYDAFLHNDWIATP